MPRRRDNRITPVGVGLRERLELAIDFANDPSAFVRRWNGKQRGSTFGFDVAGALYDREPPAKPPPAGDARSEEQERAAHVRAMTAWKREARLICFLPGGLIRHPTSIARELRDGFSRLVAFFSSSCPAPEGLGWLREAIDRQGLRWQFYPRTGSDREPGSYSMVPTPRSIQDVPLTLLTLAVIEGYAPLITQCAQCKKFRLARRRRTGRHFCGAVCATLWHNVHNKERFQRAREKRRELEQW